ncbi:MAG: hypothetical protein RLZZ04_2660 [Cyanobacteriota bacterium]|jgi:hypothetical protein
MVYAKRQNNRIQDPNQINYVKSILEASAQQCQQGGMYAPEIYIATAQRIADTYSLQDNNYPRLTFNAKEQTLKGQNNSVPELTASIGDRTSTSYFLIKDSLPQGTKASPEQLTYLRPDIVSARIAVNLGIVQPQLMTTTSATIPPIEREVTNAAPVQTRTIPTQVTPGAIPTSHAPFLSKAQAIAQTITPEAFSPHPSAPTPNSAVAGLAALAICPKGLASASKAVYHKGISEGVSFRTTSFRTPEQAKDQVNQNPPTLIEEKNFTLNNSTAPIANQIPHANKAASPVLPPIPQAESIHNPQMAWGIKTTTQNLQTAGNFHQSIGKALKDMAKGEINPIQLYGDTLNIIGSFLNGIPSGIQEARLNSIAQQMKLIEEKKRAIDLKMDRVGDDFITSENKPPVSNTDVFNTSVPNPDAGLKTSPTPPAQSQPTPKAADTAINKLLKSNASLDDKLDAIEKTLDKMLEELVKIEKNLEAIQASLESNTPDLIPNLEDMVVETKAKTEVEVVANNPMAEVPVRTEIETDVIAEAKTETEATEEVEVPEISVDPTPDIDRQMADLISSYEGDFDQLNNRLKPHKLQINLSEDRQGVSIFEVDNGVAFSVFEAQADKESWKVSSQINDSAKLDILERFVEVEGEVLANVTTQPVSTPKPEQVTKEEPSLFL